MKYRSGLTVLVVGMTGLLPACGGWHLGAGQWGPIGVDGVDVCFGERPIDPANCSPANVYVCNGNATPRTVQVESYFSFGDPEKRVDTVQAPARAAVPSGGAPFLGLSEYKRLTGTCATRQYLVKSVQ